MQTDCVSVWEQCLKLIKNKVAEQSFNTWFVPIKPVKLNGGVLTIQVPSQFFYEWIEEHYVHILKEALVATIGSQAKLEYSVVVDQGNKNSSPYTINLPNIKTNTDKVVKQRQMTNPFELETVDQAFDSQLNSIYSFDTYVEGDCNRLARSAGYAVAKKPGVTSFNPLMIYGGVGLGKTHLVHAIGNKIKEHLDDKFVLYVSSEKFINQFIKAVQSNEVQSFQNFYLQVDALIIDDVQFFGGKEKTQEIFFHIFNHLHQSGKQIIMTSDRPPKDLKGLEERLLSRFKWGLTADLQQPDFETRMAIIHNKM
ncbi:MAG: chromosomal replication initiator protein DnaA, partial [Cyclobacteriaceae bacterium]|nr:chromosomal replication initiator protein DnaA [Cyclobacteriaceae bacterium]